ncbi:MTH1187 family thiamine-binding protein [bacterium]|nr:MTH1187 family thiamine-binding protein [bacterium]
MLASFSVVPFGVGEELKEYVADVIRIIDASGLEYRLGAMETTVEGDPAEVWNVIRKCHERMRELSPRVLTHVAIDDRMAAKGRLTGKVEDVKMILGKV